MSEGRTPERALRKGFDNVALSRAMSHALRHVPWFYELEPDDEGWVLVTELLEALRRQNPPWAHLTEADIVDAVAHSDKKRHELREGKIRALYGHSFPGKLLKEPAVPPPLLYHGTSPEAARTIKTEGLRPMFRQYVHLSVDIETARQVGMRKAKQPVILIIRAFDACDEGIQFYRGNDHVWLADEIPGRFIAVL